MAPIKLTVITGWSAAGWHQYGQRFAESFDRFWPANVDLLVYGEDPRPLPRGRMLPLSAAPGCLEFIARHQADPTKRGEKPTDLWKPGARQKPYNFRFDAVKFCRQGFIPWAAAAQCSTPLMCWLDGDVMTHRPVPSGAIEELLPDGFDIAYLGRAPKHSEIGFQLYRLPNALPMLAHLQSLYHTDCIFDLREWHSAYVWDRSREWASCAPTNVRAYNLTPGGSGHVWQQSPLAQWTDHLKGKRKGFARSPEARHA